MDGQLRIDTVHVFVVVDRDGTEGIPAIRAGDTMMPLIAADAARLDSLRPLAQQIATTMGVPVKLVRFSAREEVEEIRPEPGHRTVGVPPP